MYVTISKRVSDSSKYMQFVLFSKGMIYTQSVMRLYHRASDAKQYWSILRTDIFQGSKNRRLRF